MTQIQELLDRGHPVAYVGDVVGTGSSRKSATNSVLWFFGEEIPHIPNKKMAVCVWAVNCPHFSLIPWKMLGRCLLRLM